MGAEEGSVLGRAGGRVGLVEVVLEMLRPDTLEDLLVVIALGSARRGVIARLLEDVVAGKMRNRSIERDWHNSQNASFAFFRGRRTLSLIKKRLVASCGVERTQAGRNDTLRLHERMT